MYQLPHLLKKNAFLIGLLVMASSLRLYHLTFQSLWLDELYTVNDADPILSFKQTLFLVSDNQEQSPFYYLIQQFIFLLFGYTDLVARIFPAVLGVAGVYAMFLLGKELANQHVGYYAACITTFNYFHIYYSQEARSYALLFLATVLTFLFFIRMLKSNRLKHGLGFGISAACMIHAHYFGLLGLVPITIFTCWSFYNSKKIGTSLKSWGLGFSLLAIAFFLLIPGLLLSASIESNWIPEVKKDFIADYFFGYFNHSELLKPLLIFFLIAAILGSILKNDHVKTEATNFSVSELNWMLLVWIAAIFIIPYFSSIIKIPIMVERYTIGALPACILLLAIGLNQIGNITLRTTMLFLFILLSFFDMVYVNNYYTKPLKTQFRDVATVIYQSPKKDLPIITEASNWVEQYYFKQFGLNNMVYLGSKENRIDSVLQRINNKLPVSGFWLLGAHRDVPLSEAKETALLQYFICVINEEFIDARIKLYIPIDPASNFQMINFNDFDTNNLFELDSVQTIALLDEKPVFSHNINLEQGNYYYQIMAKGSPLEGVFPELGIYIDGIKVGQYSMKDYYLESPYMNFNIKKNSTSVVSFKIENRAVDPVTHQERKAFIKWMKVFKE